MVNPNIKNKQTNKKDPENNFEKVMRKCQVG